MVAPMMSSIMAAVTPPCRMPMGLIISGRTVYLNESLPHSADSTSGFSQRINGEGEALNSFPVKDWRYSSCLLVFIGQVFFPEPPVYQLLHLRPDDQDSGYHY